MNFKNFIKYYYKNNEEYFIEDIDDLIIDNIKTILYNKNKNPIIFSNKLDTLKINLYLTTGGLKYFVVSLCKLIAGSMISRSAEIYVNDENILTHKHDYKNSLFLWNIIRNLYSKYLLYYDSTKILTKYIKYAHQKYVITHKTNTKNLNEELLYKPLSNNFRGGERFLEIYNEYRDVTPSLPLTNEMK